MSTQTAIALTEIGKPMTKISLGIPDSSQLKDHELLVKVTAAEREFISQVNHLGACLTFY